MQVPEKQNFQFFLLSLLLFTLCTPCQPPDIPVGGSYSKKSNQYLAGDTIQYYCNTSLLSGSKVRHCQTNGKWTGKTPFCDHPIPLRSPVVRSVWPSSSSNNAIDGNISTCYSSTKGTDEFFKAHLRAPEVVKAIRLFLPKRSATLSVILVQNGYKSTCNIISRNLEEKQWLLVPCNNSYETDSIIVREISAQQNFLEICEVEVYSKDDVWCHDPPDIFIPNGWLTIARDKATLQCKAGYRPGQNVRLVCDNGVWSQAVLQCEEILCDSSHINETKGGEWRFVGKQFKLSIGTSKRLTCDDGYVLVGNGPDIIRCLTSGTWTSTSVRCEKKKPAEAEAKYKGIIIAVSVVVGIVLITCFVLVIFLVIKKKSEPVVVVVKQSNSRSVTGNETEYSSVTYDTMPTLPLSRYPTPPRTRPPVTIETQYSKTADQGPPPYVDTQTYSDPADSKGVVQKSDEEYLKTLKKSPLYGH